MSTTYLTKYLVTKVTQTSLVSGWSTMLLWRWSLSSWRWSLSSWRWSLSSDAELISAAVTAPSLHILLAENIHERLYSAVEISINSKWRLWKRNDYKVTEAERKCHNCVVIALATQNASRVKFTWLCIAWMFTFLKERH